MRTLDMLVDGVNQRIIKVIADALVVDEWQVSPEKRLVEDLEADSADLMEMAMGLEREFEMDFPYREVREKVRTVQDVFNRVRELQEEQEGDDGL